MREKASPDAETSDSTRTSMVVTSKGFLQVWLISKSFNNNNNTEIFFKINNEALPFKNCHN